MITKENFEKYRGIALPGTLKTLRLGVATARVAELEKLEVDQHDLQDQVRWLWRTLLWGGGLVVVGMFVFVFVFVFVRWP